jgi:hypothetical protein
MIAEINPAPGGNTTITGLVSARIFSDANSAMPSI